MKNVLKELVDKKAQIKVLLKNGNYNFISVRVLGFEINAYDFYRKKEAVKINVSVLLLEPLPKNSAINIEEADSIPISLLRTFQ